MLIVGIDTATVQVSVAVGGHEGVLAATQSSRGRQHAEVLTPSIEFACKQARIELSEISVVAVDLGPGLFTGLRVGVAAAKAMAYALYVPMIGVPSLDLLRLLSTGSGRHPAHHRSSSWFPRRSRVRTHGFGRGMFACRRWRHSLQRSLRWFKEVRNR